jgi:hypothetical protein
MRCPWEGVLSALHFFVSGQSFQEAVGPFVQVEGAAVVGEAVGGEEVAGADDAVVVGDLFKGIAADGNGGLFALGDEHRLPLTVVDDDVGAEWFLAVFEAFFDGDEPTRAAAVADEELDQVLADPLLGGEGDVFAAQGVEDDGGAVVEADVEFVLAGEVEAAEIVFRHGRGWERGRGCLDLGKIHTRSLRDKG